MTHLINQWREQQAQAQQLDEEIEANLEKLEFSSNVPG